MEQIKTQNLQGYEEYRNGEITRDQFASTKTQLEKEKLNLQKRIQEVENLIGDEKEILLKKNIPVDQMIEFMGFEKLTPEVLQKYVKDSSAIWEGHTDTLPVSTIGATIGTHAGPGAIAVSYFECK